MPTLDTLTLPHQAFWQDRTQWCAQTGAMVQTLDGLIALQSMPTSGTSGRSITLGGEHAWIPYADLQTLMAWSDVQGKQMLLTLDDGQAFTVVFRVWDTPVIEAEALDEDPAPAEDDIYILNSLKLMAVS